MDIVHITTECAPFAKVGGLGDMVYGLAKATIHLGHTVTIAMPKYGGIEKKGLKNLTVLHKNFVITIENKQFINRIWSADFEGIPLILLEIEKGPNYFQSGAIYYSSELDNDRFLYFCKAMMEYIRQEKTPDILHLHDWPTAACTLLQHELQKTLPKIVFTIHNLSYQGICAPFNLDRIGLNGEKYLISEDLEDSRYSSDINLLKGAIKYSDAITTVSPAYAAEIQTEELGCGLDSLLRKEQKKLYGILNGIDLDYWNPKTDPLIATQYDKKTVLEGKLKNKHKVYEQLGLVNDQKPLVTSITRLAAQKGVDLILFGIAHTLKLGGKFVLLGSTSDPEIVESCEKIQKEYKDHPDIAFYWGYDEQLSHLLYAGADMFLMPSIFEPCGLAQMIALHYGTIPLVRATGGLKDTVHDLEHSDEPNGFAFVVPDNRGVASVLDRAFATYHKRKEVWESLIINGMNKDFSWKIPAEKYIEIYEKIIG